MPGRFNQSTADWDGVGPYEPQAEIRSIPAAKMTIEHLAAVNLARMLNPCSVNA